MSSEVEAAAPAQSITTISLSGIGKAFRVYASQWDRIREWLSPFSSKRHEQTWVLREITTDFKQGEAVGIVGANGAGKSTLLKIIAGLPSPPKAPSTLLVGSQRYSSWAWASIPILPGGKMYSRRVS